MNSTKLLLSLAFSITTLNASNINHTNFDDIPFTTTARGAPNQTFETQENQHEAKPASPITKRKVSNFPPQKINQESGFHNTFSPGANDHPENSFATATSLSLFSDINKKTNHAGFNDNAVTPGGANDHPENPFATATSLSLFSDINKKTNHAGFNDNAVTPGGANGHQENPFATLTDNEPFRALDSNQTLSGVNSDNMLKPQNANNRMGSDSNEGLVTESSTDGSSKQLTDTGRYNGFSLGNDVKNNKSQNDDLDDNNTQASSAPTNTPKANDKSNEK